MTQHIHPVRMYVGIFAALLVLTFLTVLAAEFDLGPLNIFVALAIATVKTLLVVLFFMHVKESSNLTKLFVVAGFFWMAILFGLTFSDYISREWSNFGRWF